MRLLSYNILDGGAGQVDSLLQVIRSANPDIVTLVETDDRRIVETMADALQMQHVFAQGHKHGAAILSRWEISNPINHGTIGTDFDDSCLEATITNDSGTKWIVAAVHLHARARESDEDRRMEEVGAILRIFRPRRDAGTVHLLAGDFNANSPIQEIDIDRCKPRTREDFAANGRKIPRRAVASLLSAGYLDTLHIARSQEAKTLRTFTTEYPGQRVDYIFSFGVDRTRIIDAGVLTAPPARTASDHFPVVVEIK